MIFKAVLHEIRFRLKLHPKPCWGSLQRSSRPLIDFRGPTFKGRGKRGKKGKTEGRWVRKNRGTVN